MALARSSVVVALAAPALVCGCFALFPLDDYGPNRGTPDDDGDGGGSTADGGGDGDAAAPDAAKGPRILFVTSDRFNGSLGGVAGADNKCTALAADAGLNGSYVAWVGSGTSGPAARIPDPTRAIVYPDGTPVASNLADLATTGPRAPIVVTEKKSKLGAAACTDDRVWTNTTAAGDIAAPSLDCSSWGNVTTSGNAGQLGGAHDEWTDGCPQQNCDGNAHLYCFQK
jgi:hypothetical protein